MFFKVLSNSNHCVVLWFYKAALPFDSDHKALPLPSGMKRESHCGTGVFGICHWELSQVSVALMIRFLAVVWTALITDFIWMLMFLIDVLPNSAKQTVLESVVLGSPLWVQVLERTDTTNRKNGAFSPKCWAVAWHWGFLELSLVHSKNCVALQSLLLLWNFFNPCFCSSVGNSPDT